MARKKKHEEHENHERWLVSYADFITLLFAFFVVMYALSSLNTSKYKSLAESIMAAFDYQTNPEKQPKPQSRSMGLAAVQVAPQKPQIAPAEDQQKVEQRQKMKAVASDVQKALETLVQEGKVQVTETEHGISIEINASVLFDTAKADLHKELMNALSAVAKVIAADTHQIQIEGHTDNQGISSLVFPSNWELSAARASSVIRLFETNGVQGERMVAIGYADKRPVESNDTPEGRARNRRVTVMILAETGLNKGVQGVGIVGPDVRPAVSAINSSLPVSSMKR